jgi:enoyl-CoA hydratase
MGIAIERADAGITIITIEFPPVNAVPAAGWHDLAAAVRAAGDDLGTQVVVLRANGRGFCAGVDIKELQGGRPEVMIDVNRGCHAAFGAVYDCAVPVIAAVHGFCLGGGIGLAGNADVVIAAEDTAFGLPEVDRGALGAATHLARLVPQHLLRAMYYTARTVGAQELHRYGSVYEVVALDALDTAALALAREIAAKDPVVIRRAKEALNGIDPVDVHRGYRFEQGFTFELALAGAGDRGRAAFLDRATR